MRASRWIFAAAAILFIGTLQVSAQRGGGRGGDDDDHGRGEKGRGQHAPQEHAQRAQPQHEQPPRQEHPQQQHAQQERASPERSRSQDQRPQAPQRPGRQRSKSGRASESTSSESASGTASSGSARPSAPEPGEALRSCAAHRQPGSRVAAATGLAKIRSLDRPCHMATGSRTQLGTGTSNLGATRRLWRLLCAGRSLPALLRRPTSVPYSNASRHIYGVSTICVRRVFIPDR